MKRVIAAGIFVALAASPSLAASAKVDAAVKTFRAVSADPAKLKIFCEMKKTMEAPGDDAKIEGYMKQLGNDFQTAWSAGDDVDETSPDGKALNAAIDALSAKCPGG